MRFADRLSIGTAHKYSAVKTATYSCMTRTHFLQLRDNKKRGSDCWNQDSISRDWMIAAAAAVATAERRQVVLFAFCYAPPFVFEIETWITDWSNEEAWPSWLTDVQQRKRKKMNQADYTHARHKGCKKNRSMGRRHTLSMATFD